MKSPLFGTAGLSDSYKETGNKNIKGAVEYVRGFGLTAFEYQCGHGVRIPAETARVLNEKGKAQGVEFSLHAPYYISMASLEEEKRENSVRYIHQSAQAVTSLGGTRVVVHCGSAGKQSREVALKKTRETLQKAQEKLDAENLSHVVLCPETMGKPGQLGSLAEILELCKLDKRFTPCIDFGHLNAISQGGLKTKKDYEAVLDAIAEALGDDRAGVFQVHFSKIQYGDKGEIRHLTFADRSYGPEFEPLLDLVYERELAPHFITESAGTQAEDAAAMLRYYQKLQNTGTKGKP